MTGHLADMALRPSALNRSSTVWDRAIHWRDPNRLKICIYAAGPTREQAPLNDPTWEVWALNLVPPIDAHGRLRCDRWFDLHQRKAQSADDLRWMAQCPVPLYVPDDLLDASANAVRFPLDEIEGMFLNYFTCTFAYQIALVLYEGVATDIGLYGVDLALGPVRERTVEWACTSYWLGLAQGRGIEIHLPEGATIGRHLEDKRYGFEYDDEAETVKRYERRLQRDDAYRARAGDLSGLGG